MKKISELDTEVIDNNDYIIFESSSGVVSKAKVEVLDPKDLDLVSKSGNANEIILGDGTTQTIEEFIQNNIEIIREAIGEATAEHSGLVPKLE